MGAGSREHIRLWITLASMDGWMGGCMAWLGMGFSSFFFFFWLLLSESEGGDYRIWIQYSDLVKMINLYFFV